MCKHAHCKVSNNKKIGNNLNDINRGIENKMCCIHGLEHCIAIKIMNLTVCNMVRSSKTQY